MAKVGEADDRWIVEERADGANVGGWHWQEKDAFGWSRERFNDLLAVTICEGEPGASASPPCVYRSVSLLVSMRSGDHAPLSLDASCYIPVTKCLCVPL